MSFLTLQFGQCGNQIGQSLYATLEEDIKNSAKPHFSLEASNTWFNTDSKGTWEPRSILVDTEMKVVKNSIQNSSLKFNSVIAKSVGGSANNWAHGYAENSKLVINEVSNFVRSEVEKCDFVTTFLNFYSLSGGTGSGVGSCVIEKLRDDYPKKTIINCAVLPYVKGEISTQAYNCLLNLAKLYSIGNCTILFENERLLYLCKYNLGLTEVTYTNMNNLIAQQVASAFQPVINGVDAISMVNHLTAHPSFKFVQIRTEPNIHNQNYIFEGAQQSDSLINLLMKQSRFDMQQKSTTSFMNKIISLMLVCRGEEASVFQNYQKLLKSFRVSKDLVQWLPIEDIVKVYCENTPFLKHKRFFTRLCNSNSVVGPLNSIVDDAWNAFTHGAYLHHYSKYGIDEEFFLNSFQIMENLLYDYQNI